MCIHLYIFVYKINLTGGEASPLGLAPAATKKKSGVCVCVLNPSKAQVPHAQFGTQALKRILTKRGSS